MVQYQGEGMTATALQHKFRGAISTGKVLRASREQNKPVGDTFAIYEVLAKEPRPPYKDIPGIHPDVARALDSGKRGRAATSTTTKVCANG
jgi:hypothetical protein